MAGIFDPDLETGSKVIQDAARAYRAQSSMPAGLGAATREIITGPVSYGMSKVSDMVAPYLRAGSQFAQGLTGAQPAPAAPPTVTPTATPRPAAPRPATAIESAAAAPLSTPAATMAPRAVNPAAYAPTQYTPTPSLEPIRVDPTSAILSQLNNGTWSGMMNAKTMARRVDADRTAQVAATNAESTRLGSLASMKNADSVARRTDQDQRLTDSRIAESDQRLRAGNIDLADREETDNLRRLAAQGDQKALARYRNVMAAKAGKDPDASANEKLLDAYIRSTAEFSKDPANMGKPAPSFQEFVAGLPRGMFPSIEKYVGGQALPQGAVKQVGTSGGRPVYQMRDGTTMIDNGMAKQPVSTIGVRG